ncbi:MAG: hypothetical protein VYA84_01785 [Planctomycetota bacterium]|nr:hypothetical protein [Planctomycetota bacterium]
MNDKSTNLDTPVNEASGLSLGSQAKKASDQSLPLQNCVFQFVMSGRSWLSHEEQ